MNNSISFTRILIVLFLFSLFVSTLDAQWVKSNGPISRGGKIYDICLKDSKVYIGHDGGISVSEDFGKSWKKLSPEMPTTKYMELPVVSSLAANENNLFATNAHFYSYSEGDESWKKILDSPLLGQMNSIFADNNWIIAGTAQGAVFNSIDGGINWEPKHEISHGYFTAEFKDSIGLVGSNRIMRTTDFGTTWDAVFIPTEYDPSYGSFRIHTISIDDNFVYTGLGNVFFKSNDLGLTWAESSKLNCTSINDIIIFSSESQLNYVFAATDSGIFRSSDEGSQWNAINTGLSAYLIFSIALQENGFEGNPTLYAGAVGGIFRSTDFGENWVKVGIEEGMKYLTADGANLFTGTTYTVYKGYSKYRFSYDKNLCQIYHSPDGGVSWFDADSVIRDSVKMQMTGLAARENNDINSYNLFASFHLGGGIGRGEIFASNNNGENWTSIFPNQKAGSFPKIAVNSSGIFLSTSVNGTYRSVDFDDSWEQIDSGLVFLVSDSVYHSANPNCFTFNDNKIYAGSSMQASLIEGRIMKNVLYNSVFYSDNNGTTWQNLNLELPNTLYIEDTDTLSTLSCIFTSDNYLLVGMDKYNHQHVEKFGGGIYRFINTGNDWVLAGSALIGIEVIGFEEYYGTILAVTENHGIYISNDNGKGWTEYNLGLDDLNVLSTTNSNSDLFASTPSGLWKIPLSEITSINGGVKESLPHNFNLNQNYPNPFNPSTMIKYSISKNALVKIKVFDILGREIVTLVNEEKPMGNYEIEFDGTNLTSGVYFYQLEASNFISTKKMLLIK